MEERTKISGEDAHPVYNLVIVGSGPAGLSAGINAARTGSRTLILETEEISGKALSASYYENYPVFLKA